MVAGNFPVPDDETLRRSERIIGTTQRVTGALIVDHANGTILFKPDNNTLVVRITHLKQTMPHTGFIDLVALDALTSYTNLTEDNDAEPK